jgi:hypothetical protein
MPVHLGVVAPLRMLLHAGQFVAPILDMMAGLMTLPFIRQPVESRVSA